MSCERPTCPYHHMEMRRSGIRGWKDDEMVQAKAP